MSDSSNREADLLTFGWPILRPVVASQISAALGREVTIGLLQRQGGSLLRPILELADVRVAQPRWAGAGQVALVRRVTVRLPLLPLLTGKVQPQSIALAGLRLNLTRARDGRLNWTDRKRPTAPPLLGNVSIADGQIDLVDAQSGRSLRARFDFTVAGFNLSGQGLVDRNPIGLVVRGAAIDPTHPAAKWPFKVALSSSALLINLNGIADHPLDFDHFEARLASRGHDLHDLGKVIEVGLPGTQPFTLYARVRHDAPDWTLGSIVGTLGRSDFAGLLKLRSREGRPFVEGAISARQLDFRDLSSDAGHAIAAAHFRRFGPRLFPETPIHLEHLRNADGTVQLVVHRLLFAKRSPFVSLAGTATLDHGVLTVRPLQAGLIYGRLAGTARVDHRGHQPILSLDLTLTGSRLEHVLVKPTEAQGPLRGRVHLTGAGRTVREALAVADGSVALVVEGGTLPKINAELVGQDAGGLVAGSRSVTLRCAIAHFTVRHGLARPSPMLIDTAVSRGDASGNIDLSDERINLTVAGRRKSGSVLRLAGPLKVSGILSKPMVGLSPRTRAPKGVLKAVVRALTGSGRDPPAEDANCSTLVAHALR